MEKGKVLAIDYGKKMVGVAGGDLEIGIAFPRSVIVNKGVNFLIDEVLKLCDEAEAVLVVIGMPSAGNSIVDEIEGFGRLLEVRGVAVKYVDEDFSSLQAKQMMEGFDVARHDANAAQIILQRFFDSR